MALWPCLFDRLRLPKRPLGETRVQDDDAEGSSHPYVAPDGKLPNPAWATITALQVFEANPETLSKASPNARREIEQVLCRSTLSLSMPHTSSNRG